MLALLPLRRLFLSLALMACCFTGALPLPAQAPAQSAAQGPTAEQLQSWVQIRSQRVELLRDEIKAADARLESRIEVIVNALESVRDSKDSKTKVARMKETTMKGLMNAVKSYDNRRATIRGELTNPRNALTDAEKRKIIAALDERIDRRVQQIERLHRSMPAHEDYERYKATGSNVFGTDYARNEDYDQNRRLTSHSNQQRTAFLKELDQSIARLDQQGRKLKVDLAATPAGPHRDALKGDLARNEKLIAERRQQKLTAANPVDGSGKPMSQKEAQDMDSALQKSVAELRQDFNGLFSRYNTLIAELSALHVTENALAAKKG